MRSAGALDLQTEFVRDHGDEFRVGRLATGVVDGVSKVGIQGIQIAPIPSDFNRVADGALHSGGSRLKFFRHRDVYKRQVVNSAFSGGNSIQLLRKIFFFF